MLFLLSFHNIEPSRRDKQPYNKKERQRVDYQEFFKSFKTEDKVNQNPQFWTK